MDIHSVSATSKASWRFFVVLLPPPHLLLLSRLSYLLIQRCFNAGSVQLKDYNNIVHCTLHRYILIARLIAIYQYRTYSWSTRWSRHSSGGGLGACLTKYNTSNFEIRTLIIDAMYGQLFNLLFLYSVNTLLYSTNMYKAIIK